MPILTAGSPLGTAPVVITGSGAPAAGTANVQTLTFGGTPTGGTFQLAYEGFTTAPISWTATDATLVSNIDAALEALPSIGTSGCVVADVTLTSGIGDASITFAVKRARPLIVVANNSLTGTLPTLSIAETTAGVDPTGSGSGGSVPIGGLYSDLQNGKLYINTGTALAPTWTVVGTQT